MTAGLEPGHGGMTMRTTRTIQVLAIAGLLSLAPACGEESPFWSGRSGYADPGPPPTMVTDPPLPPLPPLANVETKALLVTDEALLAERSDGTRVDAPWSFRHLVETLTDPALGSAVVQGWLASWQTTSTSAFDGNLPLDVRASVKTEIACPWLRATPANGCDEACEMCESQTYDLAKAPFRLLAIVNRLDLAETTTGCDTTAAEGRFVFVATRDGVVLPFSIIFEYGVAGAKAGEPSAWRALSSLQGNEYGNALEGLTRSFTDPTMGRPPALKQLRTNEGLGPNGAFELRQFALRNNALVPTALTNTALDSMNGTSTLTKHVSDHAAQIFAGDNAITSVQRTAVSTLPRADFRWTDPASRTSREMDLFGLSTCNGCHGGHRGDTTILPFMHIGVDKSGRTVLSRFLQDPLMPMNDELTFRGRSLARRAVGQCGGPDASYGARNGGKGGGIPKREGELTARRTH